MNTYFEIIGTGTPVVFIHPPYMGHVVFHYQRELANQAQCIFYDMRGNGKTPSGDQPITISLLAEDLKHLLDKIDVSSAVIVGYSFGSLVAQEFALNNPSRVKGLVFVGGFSEVSTPLLNREFQMGITTLRLGGYPLLARVLAQSHKVVKADFVRQYKYSRMSDPNIALQMYEIGRKYNCTAQLHKIQAPVWAINGSHSKMFTYYMKLYREHLPNIQEIVIETAPHRIPTNYHKEFNHIMRKVLENF
ncbi:alpha/beta hydrolase [Bacillus sp. HMF5848]|uniref:alpha/beta fold hydrolase n=1 Tax=Bacillus sp. HMF5848 TaxID=2495421 RepID=UPI000F7A6685|nr:alpha/beta hydrolase [Bacillus sp. HMF5848]RSK28984.1 alpha/beta hydrolase [Bacillus sp. HMF5848]